MSPITHFFLGWAVAGTAPGLRRRERTLITWAAVVPDLDAIGIVPELLTRDRPEPLLWFSEYHHLLAHNLGFGLLVTALAFALARRRRVLVAGLAFLSFHTHILGDIAGGQGPDGYSWPIPYLLPFSDRWQLEWSGQWQLNAWPNFLITGALLALTLAWARRRGYSPLEMVSARADQALVATLRQRFPLAV